MARPQVGLTMSSTACYLVVTGTAAAVRDPELIRQLWRPTYRAWFPDGKNDREATAIRVSVGRVDYWEPPRSRLIRVAQAVKAVVTRRAVDTPMKTITVYEKYRRRFRHTNTQNDVHPLFTQLSLMGSILA